jgi:hypothetical protein
MKRTVSVVVRRATGELEVNFDRAQIDCDDEHTGVAKILETQKGLGAQSVLILLEDDSVARHWTAPDGVPNQPPAPAKKRAAKARRK